MLAINIFMHLIGAYRFIRLIIGCMRFVRVVWLSIRLGFIVVRLIRMEFPFNWLAVNACSFHTIQFPGILFFIFEAKSKQEWVSCLNIWNYFAFAWLTWNWDHEKSASVGHVWHSLVYWLMWNGRDELDTVKPSSALKSTFGLPP